ncbi:uncharacterized protein K02A2.6-like [Maniola jurtina]|uniref:uncharacterized protein K02A2.6-like n=1 Tax=Maniola jurtina TaxID=191418 RepID=UPI001E688463|nr:uncharacterized protein K02A2.6-like [Maniola jurtina]
MPIGKLEPFDLNSKQWPAYIRRVKQYILLNEVKDELQVPLLITIVGEATYILMCDLCSPAHPESKSFDELVKLVSEHLEPKRSEIAERHVFRLRRQRPGESLTEYLHNLKHLATTCNFGTMLEENLRDQFVSGLANELMRSRIFAEKDIKYKEAVELALALEAAEKHAEVSGSTMTSTSTSSAGGEAGEGLHHASGRRGTARAPSSAAGGRGERGGRGASGPAESSAAGGRGERGGRGASGPAESGAAVRCWRCGKPHRANKCKYVQFNCDKCLRRGHLKIMCDEVRNYESNVRNNCVLDGSVSEEDDFFNLELAAKGNGPYFLKVQIDEHLLECEIDTGSRISAISDQLFYKLFSHKKLISDSLILRCYSGTQIESLGYVHVDVTVGEVRVPNLTLYVIQNGSRPLLGRDWLRALDVRQITLKEIADDRFVDRLTAEFPEVFTDTLGTCKKTIQLQLTDQEPVYVKARPVPLALRGRVQAELERLEREGYMYRVDHSEYGTPIVPVVKACGEIRICGDYKVTINPKLKRDFYPLPRIEELFASLSGGEEFSKIDLKHSYQQVMLSEDSQAYTAITTHIGTFVYRRTPFGLSCIPEKFQKLMEETLRGIPGTVVFLDDICVTGSNRQTHLANLRAVLERLRSMGFTVKLSKCSFLKPSVKYLGFIIDKSGLHPDPNKIEAIHDAPRPENVTQLKSFLGLLNYYGKFIPNLSTLLFPLHALLKKDVTWKWNARCEAAFSGAKSALLGDKVLAHYEEGRPLVLSVDSSAYGLGAVLAHRYPDGSERPVSCVSRTLNDTEKNYSQLDKEALAIFFGITKHHQYIFGRQFILRTDHQPLSFIFGKKCGIPQTAASRLQRWAARLSAYDFTVEFVRSSDNGPADALSRLPLPCRRATPSECVSYVQLIEENLPISFKDVSKETKKDPLLSKIVGFVMFGWPSSVAGGEEEKAYFARRNEIVLELGCLIYKYRIIVPPSLREGVLKEIHEGHLGINKMKNVSRSYVYWPSLDRDIEDLCRECEACRIVRDSPPRATLHPWEYPLCPWQRVHADFAECAGKKYLIVLDAHSKWVEVISMTRTDAESTILAFQTLFARFGQPAQLVTDNGPPFSALDFKNFCANNGIKSVTTAPYRPQGNGAAENMVKTVKKVIKRALFVKENVSAALNKFLFQYRNCEHATTGVSPAVLMLGRRLRGRLDALRPDVSLVVRSAQERQINQKGGMQRQVGIGDTVMARDYSSKGNKWTEGVVVSQTGPVSYKVDMGNGVEWRRHRDQVIKVNKKNRYSLARTSTLGQEAEQKGEKDDERVAVDSDADVTFEDAVGSPGGEGETQAPEDVHSPTPPPPGASARALRAYHRKKKV